MGAFSVTACYRANGNFLILNDGKCRQISRNVLNFQRYNAITNRLLYQLSYVGLNDLRGFCCISVSHFPGPSASTTTEKRNLTVDSDLQNNTSNLMS